MVVTCCWWCAWWWESPRHYVCDDNCSSLVSCQCRFSIRAELWWYASHPKSRPNSVPKKRKGSSGRAPKESFRRFPGVNQVVWIERTVRVVLCPVSGSISGRRHHPCYLRVNQRRIPSSMGAVVVWRCLCSQCQYPLSVWASGSVCV